MISNTTQHKTTTKKQNEGNKSNHTQNKTEHNKQATHYKRNKQQQEN